MSILKFQCTLFSVIAMVNLKTFIFLLVTSQVVEGIKKNVVPKLLENRIQTENGSRLPLAQTDKSFRIVSGWQAVPGQIPYQTSMRAVSSSGTVSGCGGCLIHRQWMLTAAHCTAQMVTLIIRAGVTELARPQYISETTVYYNHPTYDNLRPREVQANDISIVQLLRPVVYSDLMRPIRVQKSEDAFRNYEDERVIASGFGRLWTGGQAPEMLQWVYLKALSNPTCIRTFGETLITDNAICARYYNVTSQSVCQGDNGGPLVHVENGIPYLIGISSFVAGSNDGGCHSGHPAAFIRPGPFHDWFQRVTGIDFNDPDEDEYLTTTEPPTTTTVEPEPEENSSEEDSDEDDSEEDQELLELMKRLDVKVNVRVRLEKLKKKRKKQHESEL